MTATRMGHEVWLMGVDDFAHDPDGSVTATARTAPAKNYRSLKTYLESVQSDEAVATDRRRRTRCPHDAQRPGRGRQPSAPGR